MVKIGVTRKLLNCKHESAGVYSYIRRDSILEDILTGDVPKKVVEVYFPSLVEMEICWDCGSTRQRRLRKEWGEWLPPHIWRPKGGV